MSRFLNHHAGDSNLHLVEDPPLRPKKKRKSFIGQSVLVMMGTVVFFFTAFTCVDLPTATPDNIQEYSQEKILWAYNLLPERWQSEVSARIPKVKRHPYAIEYSPYCPYVPAAVALGYIFGTFMAVTSAAVFLVLGILGPLVGLFVFAQGGGLNYYLQPGFGYLVGIILAAWLTGKITADRRTSLSQIAGILAGVVAVHLIGAAYLFGAYLFFYIVEGSKTFLEWQPFLFKYLRNLSWYALPYDVLFSIAAVGLAFPLRFIVKVLTVPEQAPRQRSAAYDRRALEELSAR